MTDLALYGGPKKRDIINRAYGLLGQSFTEFEIGVEEYDAGLMCLNDTMAELEHDRSVALGFNYPTNGTNGSPEDESGLARGDIKAVAFLLAKYLAPSIGKTLPPEATAAHASSISVLYSKATIPQMEMGRGTIRGAGNRRMGWLGPFFTVDVSSDEVIQ